MIFKNIQYLVDNINAVQFVNPCFISKVSLLCEQLITAELIIQYLGVFDSKLGRYSQTFNRNYLIST